MTTDALVIRDARADERDAFRALTLRAYEQYAALMRPEAWAGLAGAIRAALEVEGPDRIVAERGGRLLGSVMLFPPAVDAYRSQTSPASAPELGLHTSVSMAAAMRMYLRMGFVRAPEHDFHPPGAELVEGYRLPLGAPDDGE